MNCAFTEQQENLQQSPVNSSSSSSSSGAADRQQTFSQKERVNKDKDMMSDTLALADEERAKQGIHELEISFGGELDLHKHFNRCTKNPGHLEFFPINDLTQKHLPPLFRTDNTLKWIKQMAHLTVKLSVNYISTSRPPELPLSSHAGQRFLSVGSGCVTHLCLTEDKDTMTCPFEDCHDLPGQHQVYGYITIATAAHVVFDDAEAENTTVEFFYDSSEDRSGVLTARGIKVGAVSVEGDFCELLCVTHDRDLFDLIQHLLSGCKVCPVLYDSLNTKKEFISVLFQRVTSLDFISLSQSLTDDIVIQIKMRKCEISDIRKVLSKLQTLDMLLGVCALGECFCYLETREATLVERSGSCIILKCGSHKVKWRSTGLISCPYKEGSLLTELLYSRNEFIWKFLLDKVQILTDDPVNQVSWNEFFTVSLQLPNSLCEFLIVKNLQLDKLFEGNTQLISTLNGLTGEKKLQSNISVFFTIMEEFFNRINDQGVEETVFKYLLHTLGELISRADRKLKDFHGLNIISDIFNIVKNVPVTCASKLHNIREFMDSICLSEVAESSWTYLEHDCGELPFLHLMDEFFDKMIFNDDQITHQNVFKTLLVSIGELVSMVASKLLNQKNIKLIQQVHFCLDETLKFVNRFDDYLVKQSIISGFLNKIDEFLNAEPDISEQESDEEVLNRTGEILTLVKQIKCEFDVHLEQKNSLSKFIFRMCECISHILCKIAQGKTFDDFLKTLCAYAYKIDELMNRFDDQLIMQHFVSGFVSGINEYMNSMFVVRVSDYVTLSQTVNEVLDIMSNIMKRIDDWSVRHIVFSTFLYNVQCFITESFVLQKQDANLIILDNMMQIRDFNRESHSISRSEDEQVQENIRSEDEQVQENIRSEDEQIQENINKVHVENQKVKISTVLAELNDLSNQIDPVSRVLDVIDKYVNDLHDQQTEQHIFRGVVTDMIKVFEISDFEWERKKTFILKRMQKNLSKTSEIVYEIALLLNTNEVEHLQQNHDDWMRKIKEQQKQVEEFRERLRSTELKLLNHHETCLNKYFSQVKQQNIFSSVSTPQDDSTECMNRTVYQQILEDILYGSNVDSRDLEVISIPENYLTSQKGITEHCMNTDNTVGWLLHISHPHSQSKQVSFGEQTDCLTGHGHYKQLYTAPTCSGSSGGPVWMIPGTGDLSQVYGVPHSGHHGNQLNCGCSLTLYPWNEQT